MSTLKTGALRGTSGTADSIQLHASNQSVTFPGNVTVSGTMTGGGKVLQVQFAQVACANSNEQDITATSYTAITQPTLAITPGASGNKIMISTSLPFNYDNDDSGIENGIRIQLLRTQSGLSDVIVGTYQSMQTGEHSPGGWLGLAGVAAFTFIDTTVNANAITYKYQAKNFNNSDGVRFHLGDSHDGTGSSIIATEFA